MQWGLCNLPQPQAFKFLEKARNSISKTSGIVFIKENEGDKDSIEIDVKDCTVVRTHRSHLELFNQCGFKLVREMLQPDWPADLYDVRMYCLTAKWSPCSIVPCRISAVRFDCLNCLKWILRCFRTRCTSQTTWNWCHFQQREHISTALLSPIHRTNSKGNGSRIGMSVSSSWSSILRRR